MRAGSRSLIGLAAASMVSMAATPVAQISQGKPGRPDRSAAKLSDYWRGRRNGSVQSSFTISNHKPHLGKNVRYIIDEKGQMKRLSPKKQLQMIENHRGQLVR